MGRKRKGEKIDGWLVIDKPHGLGSTKVVSKVRYLTKAQKVGHAGTLDPAATGILPIALGEATKTVPYIMDASKEYDFTVKWGETTDSLDAEGEITESGGKIPELCDIEAVLGDFVGTIDQVPPAFSAIKIDGKRAYALARAGNDVELSSRPVEIQSLSIKSHDADAGETTFHVGCGKGTYVRSLARDIALALGTIGYVTMLRRIRVGPFSLKSAISLEKLETICHGAPAQSIVLSVLTALDDIPALAITEAEATDIRFGRAITFDPSLHDLSEPQGHIVLVLGDKQTDKPSGEPVAIATIDGSEIKPLRVFNI